MDQNDLKDHLHKLIDELSDESVLRSIYILLSVSKLKEDKDWFEQLPEKIKEHLIESIFQQEGIAPEERGEILKKLKAEKNP